jgi:hypothetical protein
MMKETNPSFPGDFMTWAPAPQSHSLALAFGMAEISDSPTKMLRILGWSLVDWVWFKHGET